MNTETLIRRTDPAALLAAGRHHNPMGTLGWHREAGANVYRAFLPYAETVSVWHDGGWQPLARAKATALFTLQTPAGAEPARPIRLRVDEGGALRDCIDPYGFAPSISDFELHLFNAGRLLEAYRMLGANVMTIDGITGVRFAVWAPNAERVSVVGDFNRWDGRCHPMQNRGASGVWELFIPELAPGALYKFELRNRQSAAVFVKSDPYARAFEMRPATAARVTAESDYRWSDAPWLSQRAHTDWLHAPCNVYELHAGSWMRHPDGRFYNFRELAQRLVPYVSDLGCTHIELMPITEHPLDESWGYQTTGYFAPTSRYGDADDLRAFIDRCHDAGIGVILDWVPGHFPADAFALAHFDGSALYEHDDPRLGRHPDWGTHVFNYGRAEVRSFLLASAYYWLDQFHFDGLRVDAVASMLYLDYSRPAGEWLPNRYGGRENIEAIEFLKKFNHITHTEFPGVTTIAEESTAWPLVTRPPDVGGLGFSFKWNMGWMHDTLGYFQRNCVHRKYHQNDLTFAMLYHHHENFILPLSHDEVVHGKRSLLGRMPGDDWQRFANLRALLAYQWLFPGKKLLFMGGEFGQSDEWNENGQLDWWLLEAGPYHRGLQKFVADLNRLYAGSPGMWQSDHDHGGFYRIDCADRENSVLSFVRQTADGANQLVAILNLTPVPRERYRVGLPRPGRWREVLNSNAGAYGGSNQGNCGGVTAEGVPCHNRPHSAEFYLPALSAIVFQPA